MSVLATLLTKENIHSEADIRIYCENLSSDHLFSIVHEDNINTFFEDQSYENHKVTIQDMVLKNLIIDVSQLEIKVTHTLRISNCIIIGKLRITEGKDSHLDTIEIDNCIFMKELDLINIRTRTCNLSVYHTNTKSLSLINLNCNQIVVHGCKLFLLSVHDLAVHEFEVESNEIRHFEIDNYAFTHITFDYSQIKINRFSNRLKSKFRSFKLKPYHELSMDMNLFEFKSYGSNSAFKEEAQYKTTFSTLSFLKDHTDISKDRNNYNAILFLESLLSQKSFRRKLFIAVTGGFLQPGRFLIAGLIVILFFAFLYFISGMNLFDALYFSGITFTTIGYGDISPTGFMRALAVGEGVLGISFTSAFLVALVKKYVD